jgi:hypothetical protein
LAASIDADNAGQDVKEQGGPQSAGQSHLSPDRRHFTMDIHSLNCPGVLEAKERCAIHSILACKGSTEDPLLDVSHGSHKLNCLTKIGFSFKAV